MDAKKKILLVDGDQNFGNSIAQALDPKKYSFYYANSARTGIQMAFDLQPDLILCSLSLEPIDGYDVFRAFKTTSSKEGAAVVFLSDHAIVEPVNPSAGLKVMDVIIKPDNTDEIIQCIESRIQDSRAVREEMSYDFNALLQVSPYGIIVFAKDRVLKVNSSLLDMIGSDGQSDHLKLEDIFERSSVLKIRHWIKLYSRDHPCAFNDQIMVKNKLGEKFPMSLKLSEFKANGETIQFIGFVFQPMNEKNVIVNYQLASEVCNMLKRENLAISVPLEKKITQIIKLRTVDNHHQHKTFFTKRENDVLRLTIEGLSIKVIADKLSISSRTVEKYRTKLMEKSGAKNIVEVIVFSLKNNLVKI